MDSQDRLPLHEYMPCFNPIYPEHYNELYMDIKQHIERGEFTNKLNQMIEQLMPFGETNYTVWIAKKKIYQAGETTIQHEDQYSAELLKDNEKNFQLWDFRDFIFSVTKNHEREFALIDKVLETSPKNYHCWARRVGVVNQAKNFAEEIQRTQKLIDADVLNNSPWTYRAHCFRNLDQKDYKAEIAFVMSQIQKSVGNQAAWNYLRGLFPSHNISKIKEFSPSASRLLNYDDYPEVLKFCQDLIKDESIEDIKKAHAYITLSIIYSQKTETKEQAIALCVKLIEVEPERQHFYRWLSKNI